MKGSRQTLLMKVAQARRRRYQAPPFVPTEEQQRAIDAGTLIVIAFAFGPRIFINLSDDPNLIKP